MQFELLRTYDCYLVDIPHSPHVCGQWDHLGDPGDNAHYHVMFNPVWSFPHRARNNSSKAHNRDGGCRPGGLIQEAQATIHIFI